jgi:hypothetical protein
MSAERAAHTMQQQIIFSSLYRIQKTSWLDGNGMGLPGWRVRLGLGRHESGVDVIASLEIEPAAAEREPVPGVGITGRLLRLLRLPGDSTVKAIRARRAETTALIRAREKRRTTAGRPAEQWTDSQLRKLAHRLSMKYDGRGGEKLAREFGVTRKALRAAVLRCRKRGFLPQTEGPRKRTTAADYVLFTESQKARANRGPR